MTHILDQASLALLSALVSSGIRAIVVAGAAGLALAVFRAKSISLRLFVWNGVLYAALALPLLGLLLPPLEVPFPKQFQHAIAMAPATEALNPKTEPVNSGANSSLARKIRIQTSELAATPQPTAPMMAAKIADSSRLISWKIVAAFAYLAITLFFLIRFAIGIVLSRQLLRTSSVIPDSFLISRILAQSPRRFAVPGVAVSDLISVPITLGMLRPTILLTSDWNKWDESKLRAVLAHELSHIARHDPLTQRMALFYRAIFWFSPLAWWLNGHLASLAEQASDEAALSSGAERRQYARTLLSFFEALHTNPGRVRWQGVSLARAGQAEKRLERILAWKGSVTMNLKRSLIVAILVMAVPVIYVTASVRPANRIVAASRVGVQQQPSAPQEPPAPPVGGISAVAPVDGAPTVGPVSPVPPVAPTAAITPIAPGEHHRYSYSYGYDDEDRFVIASGKSDTLTMSGSTQDAHHAEKLKKLIPGDFIWFQRDEESYIIRDQATIDRARKLWAPQEELGRKQEELGKQQEELGRQQEELGKKMEEVQVKVPDLTAELDRLKAKLQKLGPTATVEQIGDLQSEIGELQSKIGEIQGNAGKEQGKFGELQGQLGEKQGKLGEQQGELGRQQAELAEKAVQELRQIFDEAIKNGAAKPEGEIVKSPTL